MAQQLPSAGGHRSTITITPSNTTIFSPWLQRLYVGTAGNLAIMLAGDTAPTILMNVPAGTFLPDMLIKQVMQTGTTVSNLIGFY